MRLVNKLTLEEIKQFLRLDTDAEDGFLQILLLLAAEMCVNYTRQELPDQLPESYRQAMLVIIGYFFENRNGTKDGLPVIVRTLLDPYRLPKF